MTRTASPPSTRGVSASRPPCASATERTIESPRPAPPRPVRPPRSNGSTSRAATAGIDHRAAVDDVEHRAAVADAACAPRRTRPARCSGRRSRSGCPARRSSSRRSPLTPAGSSSSRTRTPLGAHAPRGGAGRRRQVDVLAVGSSRPERASTIRPSSSASISSAAPSTWCAHRAQLLDGRVGVRQRDVGLGADHGQRASAARARRWPRSARARRTRPASTPARAPPAPSPSALATSVAPGQRQQVLHAQLAERRRRPRTGRPCGPRWRAISQ